MNQAIADIIRGHIDSLDFVDKIAGMVAPLTFEIRDKDNNMVVKTFPIACCVSADDCKEGAYNELMPDSAYKTVIYFEDQGVTFVKAESHWKYYQSTLRLVCWINVAKILGDDCSTGEACTLAAHLIAEIIRALPGFPENHSPFDHVYSEVTGQEIRNPGIFSAYTYDEKHTQYLMYPYDYFALTIQTNFAICLKGTDVYDSGCVEDTENTDNTDNKPVFVNATVENTTANRIFITYDRYIDLFSVPAITDYSVTLSGGAATITTVIIPDDGFGHSTLIAIYINRAIVAGETGTFSYTPGTTPVVADGTTIEAIALTNETITNNVV